MCVLSTIKLCRVISRIKFAASLIMTKFAKNKRWLCYVGFIADIKTFSHFGKVDYLSFSSFLSTSIFTNS